MPNIPAGDAAVVLWPVTVVRGVRLVSVSTVVLVFVAKTGFALHRSPVQQPPVKEKPLLPKIWLGASN